MGGILVILGLAYAILPLTLLFFYFDLQKKVDYLIEYVLNQSQQAQAQTQASVTSSQSVETPSTQTVSPTKQTDSVVSNEPDSMNEAFIWMKTDWPMKAGAFLVLLGFGWLTTYAFMNNWIGPMGRILLGIAGGVGILLLGQWRNKKSLAQGSVLVALGASTVLLTVFAARTVYDFFTPSLALLFMSLVVVFVAYSSVKNKVLSLAIMGLLMGGLVPLLTGSTEPNFVGLFSYLFVLCAGTLWVVKLTGWQGLNNLALGIVAVYCFIFTENPGLRTASFEIASAFAFATLFFASSTARILKNKQIEATDIVTSAGNALLLLFWINESVPTEWKSLTTAAAMLAFFVGAFVLFQKAALKTGLYIYGAIAFVYLVVATRFEVNADNTLFMLLYTVEALIVSSAAFALIKEPRVIKNCSLLFIPSIIASFVSMGSSKWVLSIFHVDSLLLLLTIAISLGIGIYSYKKNLDTDLPFYIVGVAFSVALVWLCADTLIFNSSMEVMIPLTIYTLTGVGLNLGGSANKNTVTKTTGAILIGAVILRLLAIDVWEMDITGKIITFFVIGSLLISTAFLSKKMEKTAHL